jgi:hypothetical protein
MSPLFDESGVKFTDGSFQQQTNKPPITANFYHNSSAPF